MKVTGFDLGTSGAVFRAEKLEDGSFVPISAVRWSWTGLSDEKRYLQYLDIVEREIEWADAIAYEHVQFNRGKSLIEGMRGILLSQAEKHQRFCVGVNVASLKKFAINKRWSDADMKKEGLPPIDGKQKMDMALLNDYPNFHEFLYGIGASKLDDLVDSAWVCIWFLKNATIGES